MIKVSPLDFHQPHTPNAPMLKNSHSQRLALPPIKWKNKSPDNSQNDSLANISKRLTPQSESNFNIEKLKKKTEQLVMIQPHGILKSSFSISHIKRNHNSLANMLEGKKVTFIDEALHKPLVEYNYDGSIVTKRKKKSCSCNIF